MAEKQAFRTRLHRVSGVLDLLGEQRTKWGTSINRNSHYIEVWDWWHKHPRLVGEIRDYDFKAMSVRPDNASTFYAMMTLLKQLGTLEECKLDVVLDPSLISIVHRGELLAKFSVDRNGHYIQDF